MTHPNPNPNPNPSDDLGFEVSPAVAFLEHPAVLAVMREKAGWSRSEPDAAMFCLKSDDDGGSADTYGHRYDGDRCDYDDPMRWWL